MSKEEATLEFNELFDKVTKGNYEELIELCYEWLDVEAIKEELEAN